MNIKTKLNIIGQNVKGQAQQVKGRVEVASGQRVKGTVDKIRGKANVIGANIRNKLEDLK